MVEELGRVGCFGEEVGVRVGGFVFGAGYHYWDVGDRGLEFGVEFGEGVEGRVCEFVAGGGHRFEHRLDEKFARAVCQGHEATESIGDVG